jgi:hypothetical protein
LFFSVAVGWFPFGFHKASRGWAATSTAGYSSTSRLLRTSCLHLATHHHVGGEFVYCTLKALIVVAALVWYSSSRRLFVFVGGRIGDFFYFVFHAICIFQWSPGDWKTMEASRASSSCTDVVTLS